MAKFFVGQRVRLVRGQDSIDYMEMATIGEIGRIAAEGRIFDDPEDSYDWVASFPTYRSLCCYEWQLEPILPEGAAPSIYSYQELMDKLREGERV